VTTPDDEEEQGQPAFYCMADQIACGRLLIGTLKVKRGAPAADSGGPSGIDYPALSCSRNRQEQCIS
jgi:hypothetical protein